MKIYKYLQNWVKWRLHIASHLFQASFDSKWFQVRSGFAAKWITMYMYMCAVCVLVYTYFFRALRIWKLWVKNVNLTFYKLKNNFKILCQFKVKSILTFFLASCSFYRDLINRSVIFPVGIVSSERNELDSKNLRLGDDLLFAVRISFATTVTWRCSVSLQ